MRRRPDRLSSEKRGLVSLIAESEGFTILEVLVTLVLVALMSAGLGVALQTAAQRTALDQGLSELRKMTALARGQAIDSGNATVLTIDLSQGALSILALSRQAMLPTGVSLRIVTAKEVAERSQSAIAFFPDGSSSGAEFWLTSGSSSAKAVLSWHNGRFQDAR